MKTFKNILSKALLLSLALAMCVSMTIGAEDVIWTDAFAEDFDGRTSVPNNYIKVGTDPAFEAQISDDALKTTYGSPVYVEFDYAKDKIIKYTSNSALIKLLNNTTGGQFAGGGTATTAGGHKMPISPVGDNTSYLGEAGDSGDNGYRIGLYAASNGNVQRTNSLKVLVDENKEYFTASDNNVKILIDYYVEDTTPDSDFGMNQDITFSYRKASGSASRTLTAAAKNQWKTWELDLTDADFTKSSAVSGSDAQLYNISMSIKSINAVKGTKPANATDEMYASDGIDPGFAVYIRSIRILKPQTASHTFDSAKKTLQIPLGIGGNCGDSKVTFDLKVGEESFSTSGAYRVSIANENKVEVATLQIENNGSTQSIYTISSDNSGDEIKSQALYTGDILDETITFTLGLSFRNKVFTLEAANGTDTLISETTPVAVNNLDKVSGCAFADYLVITHSKDAVGTVLDIDNISLQYVEDEAGVQAKEDLDAIVIEQPLEFAFELPNTGEINSAELEWATSDPSIVSITEVDGVYTATPICGEEAQEVTLTAIATVDVVSCAKEFTVTVAEHADHVKLEEEIEALEITSLGANLRAEEDFEVSLFGSDDTVLISWSSDDVNYADGAAIVVAGGIASVFRGEFDAFVTLTATVTVGDFSNTKDFVISIPGLEGVKASLGVMTETPSTVDGVNYVSSSVRVSSPGVNGTLTFAAFSLDANGNVIDTKEDVQTVSEYSTYDFAITNLKTTGSTEVKYYFWDANGVSIINNAPTKVTDLVADGKARGVRLNWTAANDDFDAIAFYNVYRDGELIAMVMDETTYLDTEVVIGENHTYTVVPYDKNNLYPENSNESTAASIDMCYMDYSTGTANGTGDHSPGGSYVVWYTTEVEGVTAAHAAASKAIGMTVSGIPATDNDITFEVTYLDNDCEIRLDFMDASLTRTSVNVTGSGGNSGVWKTAVVRVPSIAFVKSTVVSGSDVNISGNNSGPYIKCVKLIQTAKYQ